MNNQWLTYERKRAAFERRWAKVIANALQRQTQTYTDALREGRSLTGLPDLSLYDVLLAIYRHTGSRFAAETYKELRRETKAVKRLQMAVKADPITRGSLGFNLDWARLVADKLRDAALRLAQRISERTRQIVLPILEDAQAQNLTLDETVALIQEKAGELNRTRAEAIARTEVGRAATEGKMQGAKALGVELEKVWVSARDHRTRHNPTKDPKKGDHWVLNGQRRAFDEPFSNGVHQLMQPGDATAPPGETINCRCTVVFEVKKDVQGQPVERNYLTL